MRMTYDADADAAYIYVADSIEPGQVTRTAICDVALDRASVNLDLGIDNRLLGIEILGASRVLPTPLLGEATQ